MARSSVETPGTSRPVTRGLEGGDLSLDRSGGRIETFRKEARRTPNIRAEETLNLVTRCRPIEILMGRLPDGRR